MNKNDGHEFPAHEHHHEYEYHHEDGHRHAHDGHGHEGHHHHDRKRPHEPNETRFTGLPVLTVRAASGLSGDMILAGLARMLDLDQPRLEALVLETGLPLPRGCLIMERRSVNSVAGWGARVALPEEHAHRSWLDIKVLIESSGLTPRTGERALKTFGLLAEAEGQVHGRPPEEVTFHEVGALDSILDICVACMLYERLAPARFVCSPLPMGDGGVLCAHGWLPVPAPAVLHLLPGVPVYGFGGRGETVTPTAIALLKTMDAQFGPWPPMTVEHRALVYGSRVFPDAPNGAVWAFGSGM